MAMIRPEIDMKDSGIEYVGAIPKDWDLVRLRAYFGERKNKNKDGNETNLLSLSYGRIIRKNIDKTDGLLPASFNTYDYYITICTVRYYESCGCEANTMDDENAI